MAVTIDWIVVHVWRIMPLDSEERGQRAALVADPVLCGRRGVCSLRRCQLGLRQGKDETADRARGRVCGRGRMVVPKTQTGREVNVVTTANAIGSISSHKSHNLPMGD